jgi:hypothetical protein
MDVKVREAHAWDERVQALLVRRCHRGWKWNDVLKQATVHIDYEPRITNLRHSDYELRFTSATGSD